MTPSGFPVTWDSVGELGLERSRLHAPSETSQAVAAATAHRLIMRIRGLCISVREARADGPHARDRVAAEVEATIRGGRLHRADAARVRAEEVDLGVVPA